MTYIYIIYIIIFIFGTLIGSFLNCLIYRLENKKGFILGRSICPKCKHKLAWYDLIPIFSFIFLKARCRYCKEKISWQYPIVELTTGLLFLLIFNFQFLIFNQFSIFNFINLAFVFFIFSSMLAIFVYDLKHFIIPDKVVYPLIAITFLYYLIRELINFQSISNFQFFNYLLAGIGASLFFLCIYLISKGKWLGFGDVKLALFLGLFLGWPNILLSLFLSFIIGAIIGAGLILFKGKVLKSQVPFAPFLILGSFIAFFWGRQLLDWYFSLIF